MNVEIWQPRWHDRKVLIATHKVRGDETTVNFTKAGKDYNGLWTVSNDIVKGCEINSNGKIDCYAVPLALLNRVEQ